MTAPEGFQILTSDCGHHCVVDSRERVRTTTHCGCPECHDKPMPPPLVDRLRLS